MSTGPGIQTGKSLSPPTNLHDTVIKDDYVDGKIVSYRVEHSRDGNHMIFMEYIDGHVVKFRFRENVPLEFRSHVYGRIHRYVHEIHGGFFQKFEYPITNQ